jgi:hypothetical protein
LGLTISVTFKMFQRGTGAVVESLIKDSPIMRHNAQCP